MHTLLAECDLLGLFVCELHFSCFFNIYSAVSSTSQKHSVTQVEHLNSAQNIHLLHWTPAEASVLAADCRAQVELDVFYAHNCCVGYVWFRCMLREVMHMSSPHVHRSCQKVIRSAHIRSYIHTFDLVYFFSVVYISMWYSFNLFWRFCQCQSLWHWAMNCKVELYNPQC